ncbi:MAG: RtcB family protein [Chlorobi bacterium]|nr:RtcB family protein [Chlorobiota bacterium]
MQKVIRPGKLPVKMWVDSVEEGAGKQIANLADFPFAYSHIAIMPDCHEGYGMPIGGVMATGDVIVPNAVGVDIGCGMVAVKTSLTGVERPGLEKVIRDIRKEIPLGFKHHEHRQEDQWLPRVKALKEMPVVSREYESACYQVGTLGGGNHFIEIQKGSDGYIYVMIHSGSRNVGKQVADHYNRLAKELNKKWNISGTWEHQLAFLYTGSDEGQAYIREMRFCVEFAFNNRRHMLQKVLEVMHGGIGTRFTTETPVNIAHNYASLEEHFGEKVWVHRKGATPAFEGIIGIIPGSQGTKSYLVKGKGNPESFCSCSHGAGRRLGRNQARKRLDLEFERKRLEQKGIIHSLYSWRDLDEAPSAYKDIEEVISLQNDLVEVLVELEPLAVVKG